MADRDQMRVRYQESGGGWGNPLAGRVFDSDEDISESDFAKLVELVRRCEFDEGVQVLPGNPPTDVATFQLEVEEGGSESTVVGDIQRAEKRLRKLVGFVRKRSRRKMLE